MSDQVDLTEAELWLVKQIASDKLADFSHPKAPQADRRVRASVIRDLLLRQLSIQEESKPPEPVIVNFVRARNFMLVGQLNIADLVDLNGEYLPPLILENTVFQRGVDDEFSIDARHARLARLTLKRCQFESLILDDAKIGGDVDLREIRPLEPGGICRVEAKGCHIEGSFAIDDGKLRVEPADAGTLKEPAGEVYRDYALNLTGARVEGDISMKYAFEAQGGVRLDLVRVEGSVAADGAFLKAAAVYGDDAFAFHANNCRIEGSLLLSGMSGNPFHKGGDSRFRTIGRVSLTGSRIRSDIDCRGAQFSLPVSQNSPRPDLVNMEDIHVGAHILLGTSTIPYNSPFQFEASGPVRLRGATVGGDVDCRGGVFHRGLDLSNMDIGANVYLSKWTYRKRDGSEDHYRFDSKDEIQIRNSRIKGRFECHDANLRAVSKGALNQEYAARAIALDGNELRVEGNLVFSPDLHGDVSFERCRIGGDINLTGLRLHIQQNTAPVVKFCDTIVDRRIAVTSIDIEGAITKQKQRPQIWLNGVEARILADRGGLGWTPSTDTKMESNAAVKLVLEELTYKHAEVPYNAPKLSGWRILADLLGLFPHQTSEIRRKWLNLQYDERPNRYTYRAQPYEHLAKILDEEGWTVDSRVILEEKLRLDSLWVPHYFRWVYDLFGLFFAYGLSQNKAVATFILYIFLGFGIFSHAKYADLLVMETNHVTMAVRQDRPAGGSGAPTWNPGSWVAIGGETPFTQDAIPCGDSISPVLYALDVAIPVIDLHEKSKCTFKQSERNWQHIRAAYGIMGWIITSLTVLTLTRVWRRMAVQ